MSATGADGCNVEKQIKLLNASCKVAEFFRTARYEAVYEMFSETLSEDNGKMFEFPNRMKAFPEHTTKFY